MNLEKLNLVELSKEESIELDGGIIAEVIGLAGAAFYFGWELGREYARKH
ncbi:bacteriocin [Flavobacterium sp. FlaQc-30]